jgi:hypothetical protein
MDVHPVDFVNPARVAGPPCEIELKVRRSSSPDTSRMDVHRAGFVNPARMAGPPCGVELKVRRSSSVVVSRMDVHPIDFVNPASMAGLPGEWQVSVTSNWVWLEDFSHCLMTVQKAS